MGYKISQAKGFFSAKIEVGEYFGAAKEAVYVILREPCEDETFQFTDDKERNMAHLKKLWKACLIGHNFVNDDDTEAGTETVIGIIQGRGWLLSHIIEEWNKKIPLTKANVTA